MGNSVVKDHWDLWSRELLTGYGLESRFHRVLVAVSSIFVPSVA